MSLAQCNRCRIVYRDASQPCPDCGALGNRVDLLTPMPTPAQQAAPPRLPPLAPNVRELLRRGPFYVSDPPRFVCSEDEAWFECLQRKDTEPLADTLNALRALYAEEME